MKNLIWIFGDQHRAQATGYAGDPNCATPRLDRLASYGVELRGAVAGAPLCCPFRGSLLTSRYPHECVPGHEDRLPEGQETVADVFRENGYRTAWFGKWHLDGFPERGLLDESHRAAFHIVPPNRRGGFEDWCAYENNNTPWDCWVHGGEGDGAFHERLPGFESDALTDRFIAYLADRAGEQAGAGGKPFFAALSVQPPHPPYGAPEEWARRHIPGRIVLRDNVPPVKRVSELARRELAGYYGMIENLDWNVGRIQDFMTKSGLEENTHLLFFSDHGDMHGSHGYFRKSVPWEESIRIPFLIGGKTPVYGGRMGSFEALVNHVDIAPTSLGLCGLQAPDEMRGADFSGFRRRGEPLPSLPDSVFLQMVRGPNPWRGVVTSDGWKYVAFEERSWLLYNLNEDPLEQANLAHQSHFSTERKRLRERLAQWIADAGDSFRLPV